MPVILGIDAAWTEHNASGVALVKSEANGWQCLAVAPSYASFIAYAAGNQINWNNVIGGAPDIPALINAAQQIARAPVDIVTIDMPVSTMDIVGRREADNQISVNYGAFNCSTHSPNASRPGRFGSVISGAFSNAGFQIGAVNCQAGTLNRLIEVYPHPALLCLMRENFRIPYKASKSRKYWPMANRQVRITNLVNIYTQINQQLMAIVGPTHIPLPNPANVNTLTALKPYEDAIDALVCAWVGTRYLEGTAVPFGDDNAAIWVPVDQPDQQQL